MKYFFKITTLLLICSFLLLSAGCYGSFPLVTKVYKWNATMGDKWVNEAAFLALNIIPVYSVASFIDVIFLNSVEFWTGKSAMNSSIDLPEQQTNIAANEDGSLTFTSKDGRQLTVVVTDDGAEVHDATGILLARSVRGTDGVTIFSSDGEQLGSMTNEQIASLVAEQK